MPRRQAWVATVMASLRAEAEKQLSPAWNAFLPMTLRSERRNIIEAILTGLPNLAEALSAIPAEYQARALETAAQLPKKYFGD
jgi:hypothetical protein